MAKRKRLDPLPQLPVAAVPAGEAAGESRPLFPGAVPEPAPGRLPGPAPIASVAAESAASAALAEVAEEIAAARREGRLVLSLPLQAVDETHLVRDRMAVDAEEMAALIESIRDRGQQVPIEVAELGRDRYGLISGWRRLLALRHLAAEGGAPTVLALVRSPATAAGAYRAMVEENEIRAGLSFYERARIVVRAAEAGAFADDRAALGHLFAAAPRARRSKIGSFVRLVRRLDGVLRFPAALSEKQGLALVAALERDPQVEDRLRALLAVAPAASAEAETAAIRQAMRPSAPPPAPAEAPVDLQSDWGPVRLWRDGAGRLVLSGSAVGLPGFRDRLTLWLAGGERGD